MNLINVVQKRKWQKCKLQLPQEALEFRGYEPALADNVNVVVRSFQYIFMEIHLKNLGIYFNNRVTKTYYIYFFIFISYYVWFTDLVQFNNTISSREETRNVIRAMRIWYWMEKRDFSEMRRILIQQSADKIYNKIWAETIKDRNSKNICRIQIYRTTAAPA